MFTVCSLQLRAIGAIIGDLGQLDQCKPFVQELVETFLYVGDVSLKSYNLYYQLSLSVSFAVQVDIWFSYVVCLYVAIKYYNYKV